MIEGVKITELKQIKDRRGKIMHMLRSDDKHFSKFREIYFSFSHPGVVKAWHLHKSMTINYICIIGKIKLVLFDDRVDSLTKNNYMEIYLSTEDYKLITVPPGVWNGFKTLGNESSIIANCSDLPHDPKEMIRKTYNDPYFKYDWKIELK